MLLHDLVTAVEAWKELDGVAGRLGDAVTKATQRRAVKNALSGTWLGHPLHPLLTDVPIGAFTSALALDLIGAPGAEPLITLGLVAAVPTAAAGLNDWSDTFGGAKRVGVVHAAANAAALLCQVASLAARRRGSRR